MKHKIPLLMVFGLALFGGLVTSSIMHLIHNSTPTPAPPFIIRKHDDTNIIFKIANIDPTNGIAYGTAYWQPTVTESNGVWIVKFDKEPKSDRPSIITLFGVIDAIVGIILFMLGYKVGWSVCWSLHIEYAKQERLKQNNNKENK